MCLVPYRPKNNAISPAEIIGSNLSGRRKSRRECLIQSLLTNPEQRGLAVAVVDVSSSMVGPAIWEVNRGLRILGEELNVNPSLAEKILITVISYGKEVKTVCEATPANQYVAPTLEAGGPTPQAEAVHLSLTEICNTFDLLEQHGIDRTPVQYLMITDGYPDHEPEALAKSASLFRSLVQSGDISPIIVVTDPGNPDYMEELYGVKPCTLDGIKYRNLFRWFSASVNYVSRRFASSSFQPLDPRQSDWTK